MLTMLFHFFAIRPLAPAQVDANGGVTLSWSKHGIISAWQIARQLACWDPVAE